jgi:hypothetical protein
LELERNQEQSVKREEGAECETGSKLEQSAVRDTAASETGAQCAAGSRSRVNGEAGAGQLQAGKECSVERGEAT